MIVRGERPASNHIRRIAGSAWPAGHGKDRGSGLVAYIDFQGASGAAYRYFAPDGRSVARLAGGYVLVSRDPSGTHLLYAGVTEDLAEGWRETWGSAQSEFEDVQVFIHRTVGRQARDAEQADIVAAYDPPMNRASHDVA